MNRRTLPIALALTLAGCAASPDLPQNYALAADRNEGLAIVSLTLSGKPLSQITGFAYRMREVPPRDEGAVISRTHFGSATQHARSTQNADRGSAPRIVVTGPDAAEPLDVLDTSRPAGRLAVLRLPAGEYEFHGWEIREHSRYGETEYGPGQPFSYRFSIKSGQAVYLGRLALHLSEKNTHKIAVEDRRDGDLKIFREKYPALKAVDVAIAIGDVRR